MKRLILLAALIVAGCQGGGQPFTEGELSYDDADDQYQQSLADDDPSYSTEDEDEDEDSDSPYVVDGEDTRVSPNGYRRPTVPESTTPGDVGYHNPSTGTTSDYELEVDRDASGAPERINFPSGGWLELDRTSPSSNGDGTTTYTDHRGYEYTVEDE